MSSRKILLVDDEPHVIRILRLVLERDGYLVQTANDGHEALAMLEHYDPDVIISDIQMRGMNGRDLCRTVRQRYPASPCLIMVMTSMTAMDERSWVKDLTNTEFFEKPLSPRQLIARLSAYFATQPYEPESHRA